MLINASPVAAAPKTDPDGEADVTFLVLYKILTNYALI